jgi:hypothetical protein
MKDRAIGVFAARSLVPVMLAAIEILDKNAKELSQTFLEAAEDHYDEREHKGRSWWQFWVPKIKDFVLREELNLMEPLKNFDAPDTDFDEDYYNAWYQFQNLYNRDIEGYNDAVTILESMTEGGAEFIHMSTELFYKYYNLVNREEEDENAE